MGLLVFAGGAAQAFKGVLVYLSGNIQLANGTATVLSWSSAAYDTHAFWASGTPNNLTIPTGVSRVRLTANVWFDKNDTADYRGIMIYKNSADTVPGLADCRVNAAATGSTRTRLNCTTAVISAIAGDTFQVIAQHYAGQAHSVLASGTMNQMTWFALEVVE